MMTIELPSILQVVAMGAASGALALFWFLIYWIWKTEIQPLARGLRWRVVRRGRYSNGLTWTEWDWVGPDHKGGVEPSEEV